MTKGSAIIAIFGRSVCSADTVCYRGQVRCGWFTRPNGKIEPYDRLVAKFFTSGAKTRLRWLFVSFLYIASVTVGVVVGMTGPTPGENLADGVGTAAVCLALIAAVTNYQASSRAQRVKQVYEFHKELTDGEIGNARARLASLLYEVGRRELAGLDHQVRELRRTEVRGEDASLEYEEAGAQHSPNHDWTLLIRYFERVWNAQRLRSLDDLALVSLIGRHACWWDLALASESEGDPNTGRRALSEFAIWANEYQRRHCDEPRLTRWGENRLAKFGFIERPAAPATKSPHLGWFRRDVR